MLHFIKPLNYLSKEIVVLLSPMKAKLCNTWNYER